MIEGTGELDSASIKAIDFHTHAEVAEDGHYSLPDALLEASAKYFKVGGDRAPTLDALAAKYRALSMAAVVFSVDAEHQTGHPPVPNEDVLAAARRHPGILIPFASVDPHRLDAVERATDLASRGARGFKFHPTLQGFDPSERRFYPLYEAIAASGQPALFHTGQTGIGAATPGGHGLRLKYSAPMLLDDVAADFPEMTIVMAHPSFPWQEEALAISTHKANVYIDLSGWSPRYFEPILVRYINGPLRHKVLFGSDFPLITPERWISDFDQLPLKEGVRELVLVKNAAQLLRMEDWLCD